MINDLVYLAAFRYALGRMTYIVQVIANELIKAELSDEIKKMIVREIKEAKAMDDGFGNNGLGMGCDEFQWMKVKEKFIKDLTNPQSRA